MPQSHSQSGHCWIHEGLSHKATGSSGSCAFATRSPFATGSFRLRTSRSGHLGRSQEVGENGSCRIGTTALVCATASRRTGRALPAAASYTARRKAEAVNAGRRSALWPDLRGSSHAASRPAWLSERQLGCREMTVAASVGLLPRSCGEVVLSGLEAPFRRPCRGRSRRDGISPDRTVAEFLAFGSAGQRFESSRGRFVSRRTPSRLQGAGGGVDRREQEARRVDPRASPAVASCVRRMRPTR